MKLRLRAVGVKVTGTSNEAGGILSVEVPDGASLDQVMAILDPSEPELLAVFLDGEQVQPKDFAGTVPADGAELVIVRPIDGG